MHGKKVEELPNIALIGIDGLGRHPPLGAEIREPMADFCGDFGHRERQVGGGIGSRIFEFAHGRTEILFGVLTPRALSHPLVSASFTRRIRSQTMTKKTMTKRPWQNASWTC